MHIFALFSGAQNRMVGVDIDTRAPGFWAIFGQKMALRDPHSMGGLGWPFSSGFFGFFSCFFAGHYRVPAFPKILPRLVTIFGSSSYDTGSHDDDCRLSGGIGISDDDLII